MRGLESLLDDMGLGECWDLFKRHDIDNEVLLDLTDQDLERMGFTFGQRLRLRRAIATLTETAAYPDAEPATVDRAERRQLTVMFCDLVGSTQLAVRLDPEDWRDVLSGFLDVTTTTIARFDGYVAEYTGDGFLAYFGWPHGYEDAAEQAVRAGVAVVDAVQRLNHRDTQLQVRIGIATGLVVVGRPLGAGSSRDSNAAGATTNLAARLQSAAAPNHIVIAESTRRLLGHSFKLEPAGPFDLKGFGGSVRAWHVLRERDSDSRFRALRPGMPSGIVGRAEEAALLGNRWRETISGAGQVVLLSGDPGIGKTHIVEAFANGLANVPHLRLRYQCLSHYSSTALHPVIHAVKRAARFAPTDAVATRVEKLHRMLRGFGLETNEAIDVFASILSLQTTAPPSRGVDPKQRKQRILGCLVDFVASLATRGPVLLQFEDMQWSDPTTLELCDIIVERAATLPLMLVATTRPEFSPVWPDARHITRRQVVGLGPDESAEMIHRVVGGKLIPPKISQQILRKTDGIPLYIEELTKELLDSGALTEGDEGWTLGSDVATLSVPATLQDSLTARLDRLGWAKSIAQTAAVVGRDFSLELLVPLIEMPPERIVIGLQHMVDAQIATALGSYPSVTYSFRHALIQDAAYSGLLLRERRALHTLCAQTLEANFPEMAASHPEMLAHHYAAATHNLKAAVWWLRAGLQSLQRSAMSEALTQLRHALALLATVPEDADRLRTELEVLVVYGKALMATEGHAAPAIGEVFDRARSLCDRLGDPLELLTVLFIQWNHSFFRGRFAEARGRANDLLNQATRRSDPVWTVMGYYTLGFTTLVAGDIETAVSLLRQGISLFDPERRHLYAGPTIGDPRIIMRTYLSWGLMMRGEFSEAERELADAVQEARQLAQPWGLALVLALQVNLLLPLRGPDVAERSLDELSRISAGFVHFSAISIMERGWVLAARGDPSSGLPLAREGLKRRMATGTRLHLPSFLRIEAAMLLSMRRTAEALDLIEAAKKIQNESGEHWDDCECHRELGETLIADGQEAAGEAELIAAMHVAAERGQHLFGLRASISLARLLVRRGEHAAAELILRKARALVEDVPELLDIAAADELLARLVEIAR